MHRWLLSFAVILKVNLSWFTFHWMPSALSVKMSLKSRVLTEVALSVSGVDFLCHWKDTW